MNYAHIFIGSQVAILALCVLIPIIKAIGRSAKEAAEAREAEARRREVEANAARKAAEAKAKAEDAERRRAERRQAAEAAREKKLEAARQLAEYKRQALEAERELRALKGKGKKSPHPSPAATVTEPAAGSNGAGPFAGETLAFTGKIPGFTRENAIYHTGRKGGKGYETINTRCTILVVGKNPGKCQMEKAEKWHIKTMTWQEWYVGIYGFLPESLKTEAA